MLNENIEKKIIEELKDRKEYIYTDYRDFENIEYLLQDTFSISRFQEKIEDAYSDSYNYIYDEVLKEIMEDYELEDDVIEEVEELVYSYLNIESPIEQFLNQEIYCNIICKFYNEENEDFTTNGWLRWLLNSQGYKLSDFPILKDYASYRFLQPRKDGFYEDVVRTDEKDNIFNEYKKHNKFMNSLCVEIENMYIDYMRAFTVLTKMTIKEYLLYKENKLKSIKIDKNANCGLFNQWNGSGSVLEIALEKDIKINAKNIYNIQVEKMKNNSGYTVDEVYGICFSCYNNNAIVEVEKNE